MELLIIKVEFLTLSLDNSQGWHCFEIVRASLLVGSRLLYIFQYPQSSHEIVYYAYHASSNSLN